MKNVIILAVSALMILATSCRQQSGSQQLKISEAANASELYTEQQVQEVTGSQITQTQYFHWVCKHGDHTGAEIVFSRRGDDFRGEYLDPGFQDYFSIPVMGMIDDEGNVTGVSAATSSDALHGKLSGTITGDTFHAVWLPTSTAAGAFREMKMTREKLSTKITTELAKHPDVFYNILYPEATFVTVEPGDHPGAYAAGGERSRMIPFLPETPYTQIAYGYAIGEWESRHIHLGEGAQHGEIEFHLHIEEGGMYDTNIQITGIATLNGNTFHYNEKGYQFEVAVYKDFITIKTITGDLDGSKVDGIYPAPLEISHYVNF